MYHITETDQFSNLAYDDEKFYTDKGWIRIPLGRFPVGPDIGDTVILDDMEFTYNVPSYPQNTWVITNQHI